MYHQINPAKRRFDALESEDTTIYPQDKKRSMDYVATEVQKDPAMFSCANCTEVFKTKVQLKKHMKTKTKAHLQTELEQLMAGIAKARAAMKARAATVDRILEEKKHSCHMCKKVFPNKDSWEKHLKLARLLFECPQTVY